MSLVSTGTKIHKRALVHPPIPSPYAGKQDRKVVYMSSKTTIMSAFKRAKHLLAQSDKRATQSSLARSRMPRGRDTSVTWKDDDPDEILVKATGKVIEKALKLTLFLQNQEEYSLKTRTYTVDAIDDIVPGDDEANVSVARELPETRIRHLSVLEIAISLR